MSKDKTSKENLNTALRKTAVMRNADLFGRNFIWNTNINFKNIFSDGSFRITTRYIIW